MNEHTERKLIVPGYRRDGLSSHPDYLYPEYKSTLLRAPDRPLTIVPHTLTEVTGPVYGHGKVKSEDSDLTKQHAGEPIGERITVSGKVMDEGGRPVRDALIEIWQANSAGRYIHQRDQHPAPLDPNFTGAGRCMTDGNGDYSFTTIKPGAYPWGNHENAWRPAHIHLSLFGSAFLTRLVTQMYFPGDPLFEFDPILDSVRDARSRERLVSRFDLSLTQPGFALGYRFDIVLRGRDATPFEKPHA